MSNFFVQNSVASQNFTVNANQYQTIYGASGAEIFIPANSFRTSANILVTGNIDVELKEVYSKKDMILTGITTVSNGQLLVSGGEFFIKATQNGQVLKLSGSDIVYAKIPAGVNSSFQMQEFYAESISISDTTKDWSISNDSTNITVVQDTVSGAFSNYYYFGIDSMNWINCDYFWNDPAPKTNVKVTLDQKFTPSNCIVFLSVNGVNSIASLYWFNGVYQISNIPTGKAVSFIAISEIDGQYYSAFLSTTITTNHNETLNLTPTTLNEIKNQLSILP
jgi:hypothetical protein